MIDLGGNRWLCQSRTDLSQITMGPVVFCDVETESRDPELDSTNPHHHCWPIGVGFTTDRDPRTFYIPWELCKSGGWLQDVFNRAEVWANHNIKYDAHVFANEGVSLPPTLRMFCTQAAAHLIDADRSYKGGYGLSALAKSWLPSTYRKAEADLTPYLGVNCRVSKDYGDVPTSVLAGYACTDVFVNRALWAYEVENIPHESDRVHANEVELTRVLWDMERSGLRIDPDAVRVQSYLSLQRMVEVEERIDSLLGYPVSPGSTKSMYDLVCVMFQQPVLKRNKKDDGSWGDPSFDRETLDVYIERPETPEKLREVLELCKVHRKHAQMRSMFYEPWQKLHLDGVLHAWYNQNLRTGRLSCSSPNEQQLNKEAKRLIRPRPGYAFCSFDQSQVEFRLIIHFIRDERTIRVYKEQPDTDFHDWVSHLCEIPRRPAKTVNFSTAFGQGLKELARKLAAEFRKMGQHLSTMQATAKAKEIRRKYFKTFPTLKPTSDRAEVLARDRGYVRNAVGRRLHLPGRKHNLWLSSEGEVIDRCHIALCGRAVQGTAADICKFHAVKIQGLLRELGAHLVALVHDEYLFEIPIGPPEQMYRTAARIRDFLEEAPFPLRVPLRVEGGMSAKSWAGCDDPASSDVKTHAHNGALPREMLDNYSL